VAVYFVSRCHDQAGPAARYVKRFADATVLDWFRNHWDRLAGPDAEGK
jgi:hypothetical protein